MSSPNAVASAAARHRGAVLKAYRDLVDVVRRSSPVAARDAMLEEARTEIRAHAAETDESKRLDLLRKLVARAASRACEDGHTSGMTCAKQPALKRWACA